METVLTASYLVSQVEAELAAQGEEKDIKTCTQRLCAKLSITHDMFLEIITGAEEHRLAYLKIVVTPEDFTNQVIQQYNRLPEDTRTYMEASVSVCEKLGIDPEDSKQYFSQSEALKQCLYAEAQRLNLLKDKATTNVVF